MPGSRGGVRSIDRSQSKPRDGMMEAGEVDGALREARAKIAFLKQQLADLSDAVSYASDGSRDTPLDPGGEEDAARGIRSTRFPSSGSSTSRSSSKGSKRAAFPDALATGSVYKGLLGESEAPNHSPLRLEPNINESHERRTENRRIEKQNDAMQQPSSPGASSASRRMISPFARYASVDFAEGVTTENGAGGNHDRHEVIADIPEVLSEDEEIFHSSRSSPGPGSSCMECRSPSPDDTTYPQTPVRAVEAGARMNSEPLLLDDTPDTTGRVESSTGGQAPLSSGHHIQRKPSLPADAFVSQLAGLDPSTDEDAEFGRDAIAWILSSLCMYMTWPGKDVDQNPFGPIHPSHAVRMSRLDSDVFSVPDVAPEAKAIREATAAHWKAGAVPIVKKLWELIAGIIESQDDNNGLDAKSCWSSGRSLHCAADGLPFAFTVHTFTSPGVPCVVGRANVSAEVCCADAGKSPNCIFQGDDEEEGSNSCHPEVPGESSQFKRSLSGQLVNGHFITTHDSLEQLPSRVVDASLDNEPPTGRRYNHLRQPSSEIAEISKGFKNRRDRSQRTRRESREETFSFHSESSKTSSQSEQGGDVAEHDHLGTADLTAFIRSPEDAPTQSSSQNESKFLISPIDEFDGSSPDLMRDGATSVGTESGSLSFHHKNATSRISNEQFDTADLSGFLTPPAGDKLPSVTESDGAETDKVVASSQLPRLPPSFGAVDLVWEVRYLDNSGKKSYAIDLKLAPSDSDDEEGSGRTWDTYPGNSDSEESAACEDSLFSVEHNNQAAGENGRGKVVHRKTHSADMEIMRSVSLKGFLANQAEQRKNSRRRMENVETVAEIESVGSASSKKHVSSPSSRRGRPPLNPTGRNSSVNGERRPDRVPPHSSGSRKELLTKDKLKQKAQKKGRLPKLSSLVKRMRSFIGSRSTKPEGESAMSTVRAIKSERALPRPERMLPTSKSGPGPRISQSAKVLRRDTMSIEVETSPGESQPVPPAPSTPIDRQLSVESIPVQESKGTELTLRNDPSTLQDAFWGFPASVTLPVKDLGNGRYLIMGHLAGEGQYEISIKVGGKHIMESPLQFTVVPPRMLGSGITPAGPFYPHPSLPYFPSENTPLSPHPRFPPCHSVSYDAERLDYAYRHPHIGCVDLLLAIDATASMTAEIAELPSVVRQLSSLIGEIHLCMRVRFGVIGYRDHWPEDDHSFVLCKLDFTEDIDKVCSFILSLQARGGGDYPEALEAALLDAAEGVSWWPFSSRLVIWIGDAPPHGYEGMGPKQAMEQEVAFLQAKDRVKQAAAAVDNHMGSGSSPQWTDLDAELSAALAECDKLAMYHDNFPLGIPGGIRWEEASVRLESVGARVICVGLRDAIYHEPSQACLRSIAHLTGGALLEVGNLQGSYVAPLTAAIIEQQLDKQLVEEEVCDLIVCMSGEPNRLSASEVIEHISSVMSDAQKLPHRLQVLPAEVDDSSEKSESARGDIIPLVHTDGSDVEDRTKRLALTAHREVETSSLWVGMQKVELRDNHLEQVLKGIRSKAEAVGLSLQAGFGTRSSWLEALGTGFVGIQGTSSRRVHKRIAEEVLTSPVALRYLLAEEIISKILACRTQQHS